MGYWDYGNFDGDTPRDFLCDMFYVWGKIIDHMLAGEIDKAVAYFGPEGGRSVAAGVARRLDAIDSVVMPTIEIMIAVAERAVAEGFEDDFLPSPEEVSGWAAETLRMFDTGVGAGRDASEERRRIIEETFARLLRVAERQADGWPPPEPGPSESDRLGKEAHRNMANERVYSFIRACIENLEQAAALLEADPLLIHERTGLGETALHYLAVEDRLEAVRWLAARGAEIDTRNECGGSPLSEAASLGYVEMVRFLLESGASVQGEFGVGDTILHEAARSGNAEVVDLLVQHGADIHAVNSLEETALHEAVKEDDRLEVTRYFVTHGTPIDALDGFQATPLHGAALHGCSRTAESLVRAGASLSARDGKGHTPAQIARECGHEALASWLEAASAP